MILPNLKTFWNKLLIFAGTKHYLPQPYHFSASPEQFHISAASSGGTCRGEEISSTPPPKWAPQLRCFCYLSPTASLNGNRAACSTTGFWNSWENWQEKLPFWRVSQDIQEALHFTQVLLPIWNSVKNTNTDYKNSFCSCRQKYSTLSKMKTWANTKESSED